MLELIESKDYPILLEDVPQEYRDIAETLGLNKFLELCDLCGGATVYVPKIDSINRDARNRQIRELFDGHNYKSIDHQFRLSERQIRKIINGTRI